MVSLNCAQQMLVAFGFDIQKVLFGHQNEKSRSHTKKGPGRMHQQGKVNKQTQGN